MPVSPPSSPKAQPGTSPLTSIARPGRRRLIFAVGAVAALAACGKKGELELPPSAAGTDGQPDESRR